MQALGLQHQYNEDDGLKQFVGMLDALAFLPVGDVDRGLRHLQANAVNGKQFCTV